MALCFTASPNSSTCAYREVREFDFGPLDLPRDGKPVARAN
jgi:hypothetical protein